MNRRLDVVQHHPAERVGELAAWAQRHGVAIAVHRADLGELPPGSPQHCVLLGGPCSVADPPEWLRREQQWLRAAIASGTSVLGICLGSQLLADALGGTVHALERPECGWTMIDFMDGGKLEVLQWHQDGFTLPPGAELLARSEACPQMFRLHGHLGMQFHPEWNADLVASLNAHFGDESPLPRSADAARHRAVTDWFHDRLDAWWIQA